MQRPGMHGRWRRSRRVRRRHYRQQKSRRKDFDGVGPSARTIQREVKAGRAGMSPLKKGEKGEIPEGVFKTLCTVFESFVSIAQFNGSGGELTRTKLRARVYKAMNQQEDRISFTLLERILTETAVDLFAAEMNNVEERRILWTMYHNLMVWFENWKHILEDLGFAERDSSGELYIPQEQLPRILNVDESCLSLDGSQGNRGGRPEVIFFNPRFPQCGKGTSKSSLTTTFITGSNAAGEAIPPHFQFQTSAQSGENMKLNNNMMEFVPPIVGKFGHATEREFPCTFGMNEKGGMDDAEFQKYIMGSIVVLYPDARDVKGKRVMIKVDSGPGRIQPGMLATLRLLGFYLFPGVPNTTSVSQETDRNYGLFKTQFRKNLDRIVQNRIYQNKSVSLQPWLVVLVVFGGVDPETDYEIEKCDCAFSVGFSVEMCRKAWAAVGAAPLTNNCINDPKVRREVGDGDNQMTSDILEMQDANDLAVFYLNQRGYNGNILEIKANKVKKKDVTARHSQE